MLARKLCALLLLPVLIACGGAEPASLPTAQPSATSAPTAAPTAQPSATSAPTAAPTALPAPTPTLVPTAVPSPTLAPTAAPTAQPLPSQAPLAATAPAPAESYPPPVGLCIPEGAELPAAPNPPPGAPASVPPTIDPPPVLGYEVVAAFPHDRGAYTQGLEINDGVLYEGTGLNGQSTLRRVDLATGAVAQGCVLPQQFFGEGITIFGDRIYQLTWQSRVGFVYDKASFAFQRAFSYPTEGWGLTHDDTRLIMSDGTSTLYFLDPATLEQTGHIQVYDNTGPVARLNELEYIGGEIYANIWQTDRIARIDPRTGQVLAWIDLSGLRSEVDSAQEAEAVLNGIAYDSQHDRLYVTGKLWPKLFEIKLKP